ncbi:MAG: M48 family metallopeptidase [Verrucomicrobiota bacterium]|nr:M48 family metallopeptidase [Verrucomicrobiota bacterium]MDD8052105.1 M48 family metallopeptidase [Verrucomicrobiota bacterium]
MNFLQGKSMAIDLPRLFIWGLMLSLSVLVLQTGCMTVQDAVTGESTYNLFSMEEDVALGQEVQEQNLESFRELGVPVNEDQEQVARLNRIMGRLKPVVDLPDLPWEVNLIQTNIVNAAAAPGGKIIVFSGLYDPENGMVHNDDELAAVMAHEMAHVTCRHVTESITRQQGIETSAQLISAVLGQAAGSTAATAFSYLYSGTAMFLFPHYSRVHENEADRVGLFYMAKAGYDPRAAVEIWRRASESEGGSGSGLGGFLSSHPQNQDRMLALEANMPEALQYYESATGNTGTDSSAIRPQAEGVVSATPLGNGDPSRVRRIVEDGDSEAISAGRRNTIFRARPVSPSGPDRGEGR